jgi:uncharacterized cupredoxin-like copper-binding protein
MRGLELVISAMIAVTITATVMHDTSVATAAPPISVPPVTNHTVTITATDYAFVGVPARVSAGWVTFRMANTGHEFHMLATAVVPHGYTVTAFEDSLLHAHGLPEVKEWGGPNAVAPGDTTEVTLYFPPGEYVLGCYVVSPDGKTHFEKGMMGSFNVVASADSGSHPAAYRNVALTTYGITTAGAPIARGVHTLAIRNTAKQTHDFVVLRVLPGHTVAQALAWFGNPPTGKPAAVAVGGTTGLHTDETAYITARFDPGTYVLVCWMQTDNKYHYELGMKHAFTVAA